MAFVKTRLLCVDHTFLLKKLSYYGIRRKPLSLVKNYLSLRTKLTIVNRVRSNYEDVVCAVPQRSFLGPLFYSFYKRPTKFL